MTPMDVVKFLSETPLEEMSHSAAADKVRKNRLGRELLSMIQDDLRNAIQRELMSEDILGGSTSASSSKESNQNQSHHAHQSSQPQQAQSNRKRIGEKSPGTTTECNSSSQQQNKKGGG